MKNECGRRVEPVKTQNNSVYTVMFWLRAVLKVNCLQMVLISNWMT